MAVTNLTITSLAASLFQDTANSNTVAVVKAAAGTMYAIQVDNSALAAVIYVKLFDSAGAIVVGTTVPDWTFKITASISQQHVWVPGIDFSAGLQVCTVTTGGTAGAVAVGTPPTVRIVYT